MVTSCSSFIANVPDSNIRRRQRCSFGSRRTLTFAFLVGTFSSQIVALTTSKNAALALHSRKNYSRRRRIIPSRSLQTSTAISLSIRGGEISEEDKELDEFIDELIANVDTEDDEEEEEEEEERQSEEEEEDETNEVEKSKQDEIENVQGEKEEIDEVAKSPDLADEDKQKKKRRKKSLASKAPAEVSSDSSLPSETRSEPLSPAPIPNAIFRFLLGQGRIGHALVMFCIWMLEFIETFVPPLATFFGYVRSTWFPPIEGRGHRGSGPPPKVNAQYTGFVSSDGSLGRGKQKRKQARLADEKALEKLRQVGSVKEAKYRHVSVDFMKRHRIGPYADEEAALKAPLVPTESTEIVIAGTEETEEESDVDWVVQALTKEETKKPRKAKQSPVETSFAVGMGSSGPSVSIGVEFGIGKSKKRRKTALEAATEVSSKPKRQASKPRASDRDGGGGVIGRLRAAGANSLVSRSLMGAYPGDAVPPAEAASSHGVLELASKYGYGDWSDDEDDDEFAFKTTRRRKVRRKKKTTRRKSGSTLSIGFDISSSSRPDPPSTSRSSKSHTSTRRKPTSHSRVSSRSTSSTERRVKDAMFQPSDILSGAKKRDVLVRAPTERLKEVRERLQKEQEED